MIAPNAVATAVKSQMWLFAEFTPFVGGALAKCGVARSAGAMATPEQQKSEHETSRREFLCFRPPKGVATGVGRAAWNLGVATVGAPALFLAATLSGLAHGGPPGLVLGLGHGAVYGGIWLGMGYVAAGLQVAEGVVNTAASPFQQALLRKRWDPLRGRWIGYSTVPDSYLALFEDTDEIWLAAIRRHAERFGTGDKMRNLSADSTGRSYYDILGLPQTATDAEIKAAYKNMAKHLHPDRNPNPEARGQFEEITFAYKTLSDPHARKRYDAGGTRALKSKDEQSKREALRGVFGGKQMFEIAGDVRTSRFSRRMLEDAYMMHEENLVVIGRQREQTLLGVLDLLRGHPGRQALFAGGRDSVLRKKSAFIDTRVATTDGGSFAEWQARMNKLIKELSQLGVAREMLLVIGKEYDECHQFALGSPFTRLRIMARWGFKTAQLRRFQGQLCLHMFWSASRWKEDQEFVMNAVWGLSLPEMEATARWIALSLLMDESVSAAERQRRADALADLSGLFVGAGKPYEGASPAVMQKLKDAVMKERQRKQREAYTTNE